MAIYPLQPDRPVRNHGVQIGCCRKTAKTPFFLIPATAQNPRTARVFLRICGNFCLSLGQRRRVRQVQRQRAEAYTHDVQMGVDQAGHEDTAFSIQPKICFGPVVPPVQYFFHAAVIVDP